MFVVPKFDCIRESLHKVFKSQRYISDCLQDYLVFNKDFYVNMLLFIKCVSVHYLILDY